MTATFSPTGLPDEWYQLCQDYTDGGPDDDPIWLDSPVDIVREDRILCVTYMENGNFWNREYWPLTRLECEDVLLNMSQILRPNQIYVGFEIKDTRTETSWETDYMDPRNRQRPAILSH